MKEQKGITLIALIITIIVLIILATISINLGLGENGIINRAEEVVLMNRGGQVREEIELWKLSKELYVEETEKELLDRLESQKILTHEERENLEQNRVVVIGGIESVLPPKEKINLRIEISGYVVELLGEKYMSPGSTYQVRLMNEDTNEEIDKDSIEWSCEGEFASIDEEGTIVVSDDSIFGAEVIIRAECNNQEEEYALKTLSRIGLGSTTMNIKYKTASECDLFTIDSYATNGKINAGILPGESGYTMISMNGVSEQNFYDVQNKEIKVTPLLNIREVQEEEYALKTLSRLSSEGTIDNLKYGGSSLPLWGVELNLRPIDLTQNSVIASSCGAPEVGSGINIRVTESNISILGMKMSGYIKKSSGEIFSEKQPFSYSEGVWQLPEIINEPNSDIGDIIVIEYSIPGWEDLTEEEIFSIIDIMREGKSYVAGLDVTVQQV